MTTDTPHGDIGAVVERQAAARALLAEPLLTERVRPEEFALLRAHTDWLTQRFEALLGYRLIVDAHFARLAKQTGVPDAAPASWDNSGSMARGHTYLALILAVLEDASNVVDVETLRTSVRAAAEEAGVRLGDADRLGERRPFFAALRRLEEWGVLLAESERVGRPPLARGGSDAAIRLRVDHDLLAHAAARLPYSQADPAEFLAHSAQHPQAPDGIAVEVRRRIVEQAVVYRDTLTEEQARWLAGNQSRCLAELCRFLGCEAEIRAEGVALIVPGENNAAVFPVGASDRAALGVLAALVAERGSAHPGSALAVGEPALREALDRLPDAWQARRILTRLAEFSLLNREDGNREWRLGAAAARYRFPVGAAER